MQKGRTTGILSLIALSLRVSGVVTRLIALKENTGRNLITCTGLYPSLACTFSYFGIITLPFALGMLLATFVNRQYYVTS